MNDTLFQEQIASKSLSFRSARRFCKSIIAEEAVKFDKHGIKLKLRVFALPIAINGMCFPMKKRTVILINLFSFVRDKSWSTAMKLCMLYTCLMHELGHADLRYPINIVPKDLTTVLAAWEQSTSTVSLSSLSILRFLTGKKLRNKDKEYQSSITELWCVKYGLSMAIEAAGAYLMPDERGTVEALIERITFSLKHMQVAYKRANQPIDCFSLTLYKMQRIISLLSRKREKTVRCIPWQELVFSTGCSIKNISNLYRSLSDDNAELISDLIFWLFLSLETDYSKDFSNEPGLFALLERKSNEFIAGGLEYINNVDCNDPFISMVANDNMLMISTNIRRTDMLMQRYGMKNTSGLAIPFA